MYQKEKKREIITVGFGIGGALSVHVLVISADPVGAVFGRFLRSGVFGSTFGLAVLFSHCFRRTRRRSRVLICTSSRIAKSSR